MSISVKSNSRIIWNQYLIVQYITAKPCFYKTHNVRIVSGTNSSKFIRCRLGPSCPLMRTNTDDGGGLVDGAAP